MPLLVALGTAAAAEMDDVYEPLSDSEISEAAADMDADDGEQTTTSVTFATSPPPPPIITDAVQAAIQRMVGPRPEDAGHFHQNGSAVSRYAFHSEFVFHVKTRGPNAIKVYRTMQHDKTTRGLPSCSAVSGWYLSLGGSPFWPVVNVPNGLPDIAAACDYDFVEWPEGKNIRDEVPADDHMEVVFSKEKPPEKEEL